MSCLPQLADNATNIVCGRWDPHANGLSRQLHVLSNPEYQ